MYLQASRELWRVRLATNGLVKKDMFRWRPKVFLVDVLGGGRTAWPAWAGGQGKKEVTAAAELCHAARIGQ